MAKEYYTENNDVELSQIIKLVNKKKVDILNINSKEKSKLLGYLTRRGFRYDTISKALDVIINNTSNLE